MSDERLQQIEQRQQAATAGHEYVGVVGHPDDDECTYRADGTDATYCGEPRAAHVLVGEGDDGHGLACCSCCYAVPAERERAARFEAQLASALSELRDARAEIERMRKDYMTRTHTACEWLAERNQLRIELAAERAKVHEIAEQMPDACDPETGEYGTEGLAERVKRHVKAAEWNAAEAARWAAKVERVEAVQQSMLGSPLEAVRAWAEIDLSRALSGEANDDRS